MATTAPLRRSTVTRSCLLLVVQDLHFARGRSAGAGQRADRTAFVRGLEGLNSRAYWKFESIPLQQTVRLSPGFASVRGQSPGFQPLCGPCRAAVVGRDAQSPAASGRVALVSLSGHIPVPQCCGYGSRYRRRWPQAKPVASGSSDLGGALSFDRLKQSRAGSVDLARRAADASAPAACLRSSRVAGARQEWLG